MENKDDFLISMPVWMDGDQKEIGTFYVYFKQVNDFNTFCKHLARIPTMAEAEAWMKETPEK